MVKRWGCCDTAPVGQDVVLASDYDAAVAALGAEIAKMRAEYPYLNECLQLQARVAALEDVLRKARNVWHNYRVDSTSVEDAVLREVDAALAVEPMAPTES